MCGSCQGLGATTLSKLTVRSGGGGVAAQACQCPAGHPYYPQSSGFCCETAPFAFLSTVTGGYQCPSGDTPVPGKSSISGQHGMICPGAPNVIPDNPAQAAAATKTSSNTMYYVIGGLLVVGIAGIMIARSRQATPNRRRRHHRRHR